MSFIYDFWSPAQSLLDLHRRVNRLFEAGRMGGTAEWAVFPPVNVRDEGENLVLTAEVPGVEPGDIELAVVDDSLSIKGSRKPTLEDPAQYIRHERPHGDFSRTVGLPEKVLAEKIEATYSDGVLTVTLPKAPEARPKRITVKAG